MGRTMRTMSTQTMMPRHVHNRIHCRNYVHADRLHAHAHAQAPEILDETFADLQPESKTAFAHASEEPTRRSGMKAGGIPPCDLL
jgi:hypothetical protein